MPHLAHLRGWLNGAGDGRGHRRVRRRARFVSAHIVRTLKKIIARYRIIPRPDSVLIVGGALEEYTLVDAGGVAEGEARRGGHGGGPSRQVLDTRSRKAC